MLSRYEALDPALFQQINQRKLTDLFLDLLNRTGQNVEAAARQMRRIWEHYRLEEQTGMSFEEFMERMEEEGLVGRGETGALVPTRKADMQIQKAAFEEIFQGLKRDSGGDHPLALAGRGGDKLAETRPYEFGDPLQDVNFVNSIGNAVRRTGIDGFSMAEDDMETHQREQLTSCATVILIDISHSMILYGEDRITPAKKVAMALIEYIRQRYPKDSIDVVLFGDEAIEVDPDKVARVQVGPYHTNTKAGLQAAYRILQKRKQVNKQVFMITDGKPSAITENGRIYRMTVGLDPKIVAQTINEAVHLRRKGISLTTFMIADDPYLQAFVDQLTQSCRGKAYFATLDSLGKFIFADYARNKKKTV